MGRYYWGRKPTAEESYDLTMPYLEKCGFLSGYASGKIGWTSSRSGKSFDVMLSVFLTGELLAIMTYTITDRECKTTNYKEEVSLLTTPCNFGAVRYWFACPSCHRRVGALYLIPGDIYFRCRHCNNITYRSRNRCRMETFGHTSRQIDKLRTEIKRWTWRGRPTRKVRRLRILERKAGALGRYAFERLEKFRVRLR